VPEQHEHAPEPRATHARGSGGTRVGRIQRFRNPSLRLT
jgi:hypothetical protein